MNDARVELTIDGRAATAAAGTTVAAAILNAGQSVLRSSVSGEPRGPLCGMGVCQECRVTIDGHSQQRACVAIVAPGMAVTTSGA